MLKYFKIQSKNNNSNKQYNSHNKIQQQLEEVVVRKLKITVKKILIKKAIKTKTLVNKT